MIPTQREEIENREELAATYRSRLRVLERQIAAYGVAVPTHIVLDKEQAEQDLAQVLADLRRLRPGAPAERAPYLGLSTFQERDADLFFGRKALVAELVARVEHASFLAVLGPSGSGKSSVVRAGLIPELQGGALPGSHQWRYATIKPGDRPLDALAAALAKLQGGDLGSALGLSRQLAESDRALLLAADMLLDGQEGARLVLVVDQAEELWALAPAEPAAHKAFVEQQQHPFIKLLLTAAAPHSPVLVILTMRADFLHRAAEDRELARSLGAHDVIVSPMQPDELRRTIAGPAEASGCSFEPGLVDELIEQTAGREGALPLLEYTLLELWNKKLPNGTLTWQAYKELGEVEGALAARADDILKRHYPDPQRQEELRRALLRLVQPGAGAADTRRRALLAALAPAGGSIEDVQALLQPLADARLLTTGRDPASGDTTVEVAHEALIRAWPTFSAWIGEARADLSFQIRLEEAVRDWQAGGEHPDFLWGGLLLANAEAWLSRARPRLNEREQRFLEAGRAAERERREAEEQARREREALLKARADAERRNVSRLRVFLGVVSVLLLIAVGVTIYAFDRQRVAAEQTRLAEQRGRVARSGELAAQSRASLLDAPARALLLSVEALAVPEPGDPSPQAAEQTLRGALDMAGGIPLAGHEGGIRIAALSADRKRLVTAGDDGTARVWDLSAADPSAAPIVLRGHVGGVNAVAFSADGRRLLTGSDDRTARLWDLSVADPSAAPIILRGHVGGVRAVVLSHDGRYAVTGSEEGRNALLWDLSAADPSAAPVTLVRDEDVGMLAISNDGTWLAAGGSGHFWLWDLRKPPRAENAYQEAIGHTPGFGGVTPIFSPDNRTLLLLHGADAASLWDLTTSPERIVTLDQLLRAAAFSPDGRLLVGGTDDGTLLLWDLEDRARPAPPLTGTGHIGRITEVAFSDDGERILSASADRTARLWDISLSPPDVLRGHDDEIWWAAFDADGHPITASRDGMARLWLRTDASPRRDLPADGPITAVFSSDGRRLIYGQGPINGGSGVRLLDLAAPESRPQLLGDGVAVEHMAVSADGHWLAADSSEAIRLWDLTVPEAPPQVLTPGDEHNYVTAMTFSTNGDTLVALSGGTAYRWNVAQGAYTNPQIVRGLIVQDNQTLFSLSLDGRWLGAYDERSPDEIRLWDLASTPPGALTRITALDDYVTTLAFNAKGTLLATGDTGGTMRLWDLSRPAAPLEFKQIRHQGPVRTLTFSPSGRFLASGGDDGEIHIYEPGASGQPVEPRILRGHEGAVVAIGFSFDDRQLVTHGNNILRDVTTRFGQTRVQRRDATLRLWNLSAASEPASIVLSSSADAETVLLNPDGRWLVTTGSDYTISLWDLRLESLVERACATAGRNLSIAEWRQAMGEVPYRKTCPGLPIHPSLLTEARDLARADQVDAAMAAYRTAQTLEPDLALDPAAEVQRDAAEAQVERAVALARKGRIQEAVVMIDKARQQAPDMVIAAESWDVLCRHGVRAGQPQLAMPACDQAVALADEPDAYRLGRGVARALTDNIPGAVDDLTAYLAWAERHELTGFDIDRRRQWLDSLKQGGKLFDTQSLESLLANDE